MGSHLVVVACVGHDKGLVGEAELSLPDPIFCQPFLIFLAFWEIQGSLSNLIIFVALLSTNQKRLWTLKTDQSVCRGLHEQATIISPNAYITISNTADWI